MNNRMAAIKKEPKPDPLWFDPIRDGFWALKYPQDPNYDHKDWAIRIASLPKE